MTVLLLILATLPLVSAVYFNAHSGNTRFASKIPRNFQRGGFFLFKIILLGGRWLHRGLKRDILIRRSFVFFLAAYAEQTAQALYQI